MRRVTSRGTKTGKIMLTLQKTDGFLHAPRIQGIVQVPGVVQMKGRRTGTVQDAVLISSTARFTTRVEGLGHDLHVFDADIVRSQGVETATQAVQIRLSIAEEIDHLP